MSCEPQTDQEAANSAAPDTETLPRWDDPDWDSYLGFLNARDEDGHEWEDDEGFEICEDCGELLDDCLCDIADWDEDGE